LKEVEKAAAIIRLKAVDNPLRSFGYFVGTVMTLPTLVPLRASLKREKSARRGMSLP
jgi:hypothetical protein